MLKPGAFTFAVDLDGRTHEGETFMCGHCNRHTHIGPFQRPEDIGGMCKRCMKLTCPECAARGDCDPLEEKINRWEHGR